MSLSKLKDEVQRTKINYEALNAQLLEDLPRLYVLSISVITDCLMHLVQLQNSFSFSAVSEMSKLEQVCL